MTRLVLRSQLHLLLFQLLFDSEQPPKILGFARAAKRGYISEEEKHQL
uniref:SHOCT domain-containing protein n=1 Tax=Macrostomum lignano TaxID=282301 RepID=A0A1I8G9X1_9PLAT